jgi:hypothetical protein
MLLNTKEIEYHAGEFRNKKAALVLRQLKFPPSGVLSTTNQKPLKQN